MELVADRFVGNGDGTAIDLATGDRVELTITSAGGETEQRRWTLACDALQKVHHPAVARLIDYGIVGDSHRFEARRSSDVAAVPNARTITTIERPAVAAFGAGRPHVLLFVGLEEPPSLDGIGLTPLTAEALVGAVGPDSTADSDRIAIQRLAVRSGGWPGQFARLLWRSGPDRGAYTPGV